MLYPSGVGVEGVDEFDSPGENGRLGALHGGGGGGGADGDLAVGLLGVEDGIEGIAG